MACLGVGRNAELACPAALEDLRAETGSKTVRQERMDPLRLTIDSSRRNSARPLTVVGRMAFRQGREPPRWAATTAEACRSEMPVAAGVSYVPITTTRLRVLKDCDGQDPLAHALAHVGDQHKALSREETLGQRLGEVASVAKQFAEETAHQTGKRATVIDVTRRQRVGEDLSAVVDDQVEFEGVEPAHRGFAAARINPEDAMLGDAGVVADGQRRGVHEAAARAGSPLRLQVDREREHDAGDQGNEACVAHQRRELSAQLGLDMLDIDPFEGAMAGLLEEDQDRHDLARTQAGRAVAVASPRSKLFTLPPWRK